MSAPQLPLAGTSPAGFLVPLNYVIEGEPPAILADAIDPATGEFISLAQGYDPIDAYILTQESLVRGSGSAVEDEGRDFSDVTHISDSHERILKQEVRRPLKALLEERRIEILELSVTSPDDNAYEAKLRYRHVATGQERTTTQRAEVLP